MEPNLAGSIYVRSSIKLLHLVPFGQQTWQYLTWPFGSGELKNDEKRAISPRRVIRFTSTLQGM
jgi:hypothetical protein